MTEPMTTTLNRIRALGPCRDGWGKLLRHLGKTEPDDEPILFSTIVESNGLVDALHCLRAEPQYDRKVRLYVVWCARRVEHLNPDPRVKAANDVSERFANGRATVAELDAAAEATVTWVAREAKPAVRAGEAAWAAGARSVTTWAAWVAARAAEASENKEAERQAQTTEFLRIANGGDYPS